MSDKQPYHVFISYVRENQKEVDRLCNGLTKQGVEVWLDRNDIKPGFRWKDAIRDAIKKGAFFIACFSEEYHSKSETHMNEELTLAIERLRKIHTDREWFIPVLLSECDVPDRRISGGETLRDFQWVPLYKDWKSGIKRILEVIKPIPPKVQGLINALRLEDKDTRLQAVRALGKLGNPSAVPALLKTSLNDKNRDVLREAAVALDEIGDPIAVSDLIEALSDKDCDTRLRAAGALALIGDPAAVPALRTALTDKKSAVREKAAFALGLIADPTVLPILTKAMCDKDYKVRIAVADALGSIKNTDAVPPLIDALNDKAPHVREKAEEALQKIGATAVTTLLELLKNMDNAARQRVEMALGSFRSDAAIAALSDALKDDNVHVRLGG